MMRPPRQWLVNPRFLLGLGLSLGALLLAIHGVRWAAVLDSLGQARLSFVSAAVVAALTATVISTLRWRVLLWPHSAPLDRLTAIFFVSQTCNAVLPGKLGAPLRATLTSRAAHMPLLSALGSVVIERVLDTALIAVLSALLLVLLPVPQVVQGFGRETAVIAAAVLVLLMLAAALKPAVTPLVTCLLGRMGLSSRWAAMLDALDVMRQRRTYAPLLLLSAVIWALGALTNDLMLRAMNLALPWWTAALLLVALQLGSKLPSSPGNIGVFHYVTVLVLTNVGVDASAALAYAVVLHLAVFIVPAVVGALCLWWLSVRLDGDLLAGSGAVHQAAHEATAGDPAGVGQPPP